METYPSFLRISNHKEILNQTAGPSRRKKTPNPAKRSPCFGGKSGGLFVCSNPRGHQDFPRRLPHGVGIAAPGFQDGICDLCKSWQRNNCEGLHPNELRPFMKGTPDIPLWYSHSTSIVLLAGPLEAQLNSQKARDSSPVPFMLTFLESSECIPPWVHTRSFGLTQQKLEPPGKNEECLRLSSFIASMTSKTTFNAQPVHQKFQGPKIRTHLCKLYVSCM